VGKLGKVAAIINRRSGRRTHPPLTHLASAGTCCSILTDDAWRA